MKLLKNYFYNVAYNVLTMILPLITGPFVSRKLGAYGVGINSYTYSIVNWFVLVGSMGISLYGNRQIAYTRSDREKLSKTFYELVFLKLFMLSISFVVYLFICLNSREYSFYLLLQSIYIIAAVFDISWFFMGIEEFGVTVTRNTFVKVTSVVLILTFIRSRDDISIYILILAIATFMGNLTMWPSLRGKILAPKMKLKPFIHLKSSFSLFIPLAAVQLYVGLNKTMLGLLSGTNSSGFYDKADSLSKLALTVISSLSTVLLPFTAKSVSQGEIKKVKKILYLSFDFASLIAIPISFGLAAIALKFGPFFYGKGFDDVGNALFIEAIIVIFMSWSSITGNQYLVPTNQVKPYTLSILIGAGVNILLNIPLILKYGLYGATFATVLAELSVSLYQLFYIRRQVSLIMLFRNVYKYLSASAFMFLIVFPVAMLTKMTLFTLIFEIVLGVIIYILLIFLLKPTSMKLVVKWYKKRK